MDRHTNTHTETKLKYFNGHSRPSQSEESDYMWAHEKDGITRVFDNPCYFHIDIEENGTTKQLII